MGSRVITNYKMVRSGPIGCGSVAWMQPTSGPFEILVHYVGFVSLYRLREEDVIVLGLYMILVTRATESIGEQPDAAVAVVKQP